MDLELLKIYTLSADGQSCTAFPSSSDQVELLSYSYVSNRMGVTTVTATVRWPECLDDLWTGREFVVMDESGLGSGGSVMSLEKFFLLHIPGSGKASDDARYVHTLEFQSERDVVLSSVYFCDCVSASASTVDRFQSGNFNVKFFGTLGEFVDRFEDVLDYVGLGSRFSIEMDDEDLGSEIEEVSFESATLFEALEAAYEAWDVPFYFDGNEIHFGEGGTVVPEVAFEYGGEKQLLSIEKSNESAKIVTRIHGYGSGDNIPVYYPNPTAKGTLGARINGSASSALTVTSQKLFAEGLDLSDRLIYRGVGASDKLARLRYESTVSAAGSVSESAQIADIFLNSSWDRQFKAEQSFSLNGGYRGVVTAAFTLTMGSHQTSEDYLYLLDSGRQKTVGRDPLAVASEGFAMTLERVMMTVTDPDDSTDSVTLEVPFSAVYEDLHPVTNTGSGVRTNVSTFQYYPERTLRTVSVDIADVLDNVFTGRTAHLTDGDVTLEYLVGFSAGRVWWYEDDDASDGFSMATFDATLDLACEWTPGGWKYRSKSDGFNIASLSEVGLSYSGTPVLNDYITQERLSYITPQEHLMPYIYRQTLGAVRFLNASDSQYVAGTDASGADVYRGHYQIPGSSPAAYYDFVNEYSSRSPREHVEEFSDIMPSVKNLTDSEGNALNVLDAVFFEEGFNPTETKEDGTTLKYQYFFVKLKKLPFSLFDSASATDDMAFSMLSGDCAGCTFKVVATEKGRNPVAIDTDTGALLVDTDTRRVKMLEDVQDEQQDTSARAGVWIALYLDSETYGGTEVEMGVMPNYYEPTGRGQKPAANDSYSIINIDLPDAYVIAAEQKLEQEMVAFMWENNDEKYSWAVKFSRVYLAQNPTVREALNAHCALRLKYDGEELAAPLHVSQYTYKASEGESLPEISVELSDVIESRSSGLEQKISAQIGDVVNVVRGGGSDLTVTDARYVRKDADDTVSGLLTFEKGFSAGETGGMSVNEAGETLLDVDYVTVRKKAVFSQVEVDRLRQVGGRVLVSLASISVSAVEAVASDGAVTAYRCYFRGVADGGEVVTNEFVAGDLAVCRTFGVSGTRYYWRKVTAVGADYIVLSNVSGECVGTDTPVAGDVVVQLGNVSDAGRQAAQVLSCYGDNTPSFTMYAGISSLSLTDKDQIRMDVEATTSGGVTTYRPNMTVYGDAYVGARDQSAYIEWKTSTGKLKVKGDVETDTMKILGKTSSGATVASADISGLMVMRDSDESITTFLDGVLSDQVIFGAAMEDAFTKAKNYVADPTIAVANRPDFLLYRDTTTNKVKLYAKDLVVGTNVDVETAITTLNSLFTVETYTDSEGNTRKRIRVNKDENDRSVDFYSYGGISAGGTGEGGGGGSSITLKDLAAIRAMTENEPLTAPLAWALHQLDAAIPSAVRSQTTYSEDKVLVKSAGSSTYTEQSIPSGDKNYEVTFSAQNLVHIEEGDEDYSTRPGMYRYTFTHNLGKNPAVSVSTTSGTIVHADVQYKSTSTAAVYFSAVFNGKIIAN